MLAYAAIQLAHEATDPQVHVCWFPEWSQPPEFHLNQSHQRTGGIEICCQSGWIWSGFMISSFFWHPKLFHYFISWSNGVSSPLLGLAWDTHPKSAWKQPGWKKRQWKDMEGKEKTVQKNSKKKPRWQPWAFHTCVCKDKFPGQFWSAEYMEKSLFIP